MEPGLGQASVRARAQATAAALVMEMEQASVELKEQATAAALVREMEQVLVRWMV